MRTGSGWPANPAEMAVLARSRALLRRRPSAAATTSAACPRCRHASAAAAKKPSPWDIDLRPKQAKGDGAAADGAAQQQRKAPPPRAFSAIVSSELSDALAAMEVYAPNEMQAVRCLRPCRHSIGRPRLTAVTPPPPLPALLAGSPQDALTVALEEPDRDALFVSQTGSGKTLMFLLPLLEQLGGRQHASDADATSALPQPRAAAAATLAPHGLIIVPTPDLAVQVHSVASTLAVAMPSPLAVEILNGTPLSSSSSSSSSGGGSSSSSSSSSSSGRDSGGSINTTSPPPLFLPPTQWSLATCNVEGPGKCWAAGLEQIQGDGKLMYVTKAHRSALDLSRSVSQCLSLSSSFHIFCQV